MRGLFLFFFLAVFAAPAAAADAPSLLAKGDALWAEGSLDQAEKAYGRAAELAPESPKPFLKLGGLALARQRYDQAIENFQTAIGLDPTDAKVFAVLGMAYMHVGALGPAKAALDQALVLDPELESARLLAGQLQSRMAGEGR